MTHQEFKFAFKIEPKPEGGYVATSENPPIRLEGATREEVEQQVRARLVQMLGPEIAAMMPLNFADKLQPSGPGQSSFTVKKTFHLGGGLSQQDGNVTSTIRTLTIGGTKPGPGGPPYSAPAGDIISSSSAEDSFGPIRRTGDGSPAMLMLRILIAVGVVIAIILMVRR